MEYYELVVEAPHAKAAERYFEDHADTSIFEEDTDNDDCFDLCSIRMLPGTANGVEVQVDAEGQPITKESL